MYSQTGTGTTDSTNNNSDSRMVADILSSMANGGEVITPTTLSVIEGFCTGIPTRTTPTLTPTTLRSLEQTYLEFQNIAPQNEEHEHQAGFVPPVVPAPIIATSASSKHYQQQTVISTNAKESDQIPAWCGEQTNIATPPLPPPPAPKARNPHNTRGRTANANGVTKTRGTGGRKPNRDERLSPEEEERRKVRRERNKLAAARCRKRRMDHTSSLVDETDGLEDKKFALQQEIQALQSEKEELEFILEAHRNVCKLKASQLLPHNRASPPVKVKVEACYEPVMLPSSDSEESSQDCMSRPAIPRSRPQLSRPTTLPIMSTYSNPSLKLNHNGVGASEATGIPIQTPSTGIFNFDALMEGGTGLTPVTSGLTPIIPTCSGQQRNSHSDLASPDSKLVSL